MRIHALLLFLYLLTTAGCARDNDAPEQANPLELPAVGQLPQSRDIAFTDSDRTRLGKDFVSALPNHGVVAGATAVTFTATADGDEDTLADYAFALYNFVLPGYGDNGALQFVWDAPVDGAAWAALANRASQRWDWLPMSVDGRIDFNSLLPYMEGDNLTVAVIVGGTQTATLQRIIVGDNKVPFAFLSATPDEGNFPLEVDFSAAQTIDEDGLIVKYEWDLDGDGSFELDTGGDLDTSKTFDTPGAYILRLRVTDDKGASSTDGVNVNVMDPDANPPTASLVANPDTVDYGTPVTLDASGSTDDQGIVAYDWDYNGDGIFDVLDSPNPTIDVAYGPGTYQPIVRVTDMSGADDTASTQVTVDAQPVAILYLSGTCGDGISTLNASQSYEQAGSIVQYRYDYDGNGTWDTTTASPSVQYLYPDMGVYYPKVEVTDDDGDTAVTTSSVPKYATRWISSNIDSGGSLQGGARPDIRAIGGKLAVVSHDTTGTDKGIYYSTAASSGGAWTTHKVVGSDPPSDDQLALSHQLGIGGTQYPIMAFFDSDNDVVCYRALNTNPDSADDWEPNRISDSGGHGHIDLVSQGIAGNARSMACWVNFIGNLEFALAETAYPESDADWTRYAVDFDGDCFGLSMAIIDGKPAIAYYMDDTVNEVRYARATIAFPDSAGDWVISTVRQSTGGPDDQFFGLALATVGGLPALVFSQDFDVYYARAGSVTPGAPGNWTLTTATIEATLQHALVEYAGVPLIFYCDDQAIEPDFLWAHSAAPTSSNDWCYQPEIIDQVYSAQRGMAMTLFNSRPAMALYNVQGGLTVIFGD